MDFHSLPISFEVTYPYLIATITHQASCETRQLKPSMMCRQLNAKTRKLKSGVY